MFLGLYTKKEVDEIKKYNHEKSEIKVKQLICTYEEEMKNMECTIKRLDENVKYLIKENRHLTRKAREERHEEIRQIKSIANRTKKIRVKKKCEARLLKIRLSK